MRKITDIICLIGWSISLAFGIISACRLMTIHPICYICASSVCCLHYVSDLMKGYDKDDTAQ